MTIYNSRNLYAVLDVTGNLLLGSIYNSRNLYAVLDQHAGLVAV